MKHFVAVFLLTCLPVANLQAHYVSDAACSVFKGFFWSGVGLTAPVIAGYCGGELGKKVCNVLDIERPRTVGGLYADIVMPAGLAWLSAYALKRIIHKGEIMPTIGLVTGLASAPFIVGIAYVIGNTLRQAPRAGLARNASPIAASARSDMAIVYAGRGVIPPMQDVVEASNHAAVAPDDDDYFVLVDLN